MKQRHRERRGVCANRTVCFVLFAAFWSCALAQLRYSVSEDVDEGTAVGNVAKDLGLERITLKDRAIRVVSGAAELLFRINDADAKVIFIWTYYSYFLVFENGH
uniref:Cadherin N-terminal domain-containing protein n=1 Tax=Oryzias melastigma TaxID=30732 RepID=A0A3B3BC79_ORYME